MRELYFGPGPISPRKSDSVEVTYGGRVAKFRLRQIRAAVLPGHGNAVLFRLWVWPVIPLVWAQRIGGRVAKFRLRQIRAAVLPGHGNAVLFRLWVWPVEAGPRHRQPGITGSHQAGKPTVNETRIASILPDGRRARQVEGEAGPRHRQPGITGSHQAGKPTVNETRIASILPDSPPSRQYHRHHRSAIAAGPPVPYNRPPDCRRHPHRRNRRSRQSPPSRQYHRHHRSAIAAGPPVPYNRPPDCRRHPNSDATVGTRYTPLGRLR